MTANEDKYYTDLDLTLQHLAAVDWAHFAKMVGPEAIQAAKICLLRSRGHSLQQIANRLDTTKSAVQYRIEKQNEFNMNNKSGSIHLLDESRTPDI